MEQIRPLIIKYVYTAAITAIFLSQLLIPAIPLGSSLVIALAITLVLFFVGDRVLLLRFGALPTAIANFVITALILTLATPFVRESIGTGAVLATAAVTGVAEWIFYRYIRTGIGAISEGEELAGAPDFFSGGMPPQGDDSDNAKDGGSEGEQE